MNSKLKLALTAILLVIILAGGVFLYNKISNVEVKFDNRDKIQSKKPMPEAVVYTENDEELNLSSLKGKPMVINFWTTWCGYCKDEMPTFEKVYNEYKDKVEFILIDVLDNSEETKENGIKYRNDMNLTMPIYFDRGHTVIAKFGAPGFPTTYFIDKEGNINKVRASALTEAILVQSIEAII